MSDDFKLMPTIIFQIALIISPIVMAQEAAPDVSSSVEPSESNVANGPNDPQPVAVGQEPSSAATESDRPLARPTLAELMQEFQSLEEFATRLRVIEQQSVTFDSEKTQISFGMTRAGKLHRVDREFVTQGNDHEATVLEYNLDGQPIGAAIAKANLTIVANGKLPMSDVGSLPLFFCGRKLKSSSLSELFQQHPDRFALFWDNDQAIIHADVGGLKAQLRMRQDGEGRWVPVQYDYSTDAELHFHWELKNLDNVTKWYSLDYKPRGYCEAVWGDVKERGLFLRTEFEVQNRTALLPLGPPLGEVPRAQHRDGAAPESPFADNMPRRGSPSGGGSSPFGGKSAGGGSAVGSADLDASNPMPDTEDDANADSVKIFSLTNANAEDARRIIESLFGFPTVKVATDGRSNSIIVSSDKVSQSEIEAILMRLDDLPKAAIGGNSVKQSEKASVDREDRIVPIAEYRRRLSELEQPLLQLAEKVRSTEASLGKEHADSVKLRADLRALVQQTFAARQEIQRAELAEFTRRLQRMQQSIDARDRIADKIVERRIEELLDPNLQWDSTRLGASGRSSTNGPMTSTQPQLKTEGSTAFDSSGTSDKLRLKISDDENAAAWRQKLQGVWTIEEWASGLGEDPAEEWIAKSGEVRIDGSLITIPFTQGDVRVDISMLLELQPPGNPQGVNITIDPNGQSTKALGIIDCDGDRLRLCVGQWVGKEEVLSESSRPKVFAAGSDVSFLECRKTPQDVAVQSSTGHGFQSPEALLDYMTDCLLKEDFANFIQLLTDDEAKRIAGLMLQSAYSIMTVSEIAAKDSSESVKQNPQQAAFAGIRSVLQSSMRNDASPEAEAAFEQLNVRATQAILTGGSGTAPEFNPDDYSQLLKTAAGVLKDDRTFLGEISKALMALNSKSQVSNSVPSRPTWTIVIDGDVAIATDTRKTAESSGNVSPFERLELKRIGGYWKVSKLISDKALREVAALLAVSDSTDTKPPASKEGPNQSAIPSDVSGPETITPPADPVVSGPVAVEATVSDNTQPPVSDTEKAIARMVFVFFQDEARRAVPGLLIDRGSETLVITVGPASIVPDGVAHAIDRSFLEVAGEPSVETMIFDTKTADIIIARAKAGLTTFQLKEPVLLEIGDSLSAIQLQGRQQLRVTPNAARITAMNQSTTFELESHRFLHEFSGLVQIDQRLPEGTPLFKDGQLAGITLLGTRFMKVDVPGSYVVPAGRIHEVLQQLKPE